MVLPLLAALASAAIPALSRRGLDLIGGVLNGATEAGVKRVSDLIEEKTGIRIEEIADDTLSEEQWVKLKEFELRHQELLLRQASEEGAREIDRARLANEDRASARAMQEAAIRGEDWLTRNFVYLYATVLTGLTFAFVFWAAFGDISDKVGPDGMLTQAGQAQMRIVDTALGFLLGVSLSAIIQFFFGSSQGSTRKNQTIERFIETSRVERDAEAR